MRKYALAFLALPVLAVVYAETFLRRSLLVRTSVALGLGAILGMAVISLARPDATTATPPSQPIPVTQASFRTAIGTGVALDAPATITFSTPMDRDSVEASITVRPATPVRLGWRDGDTAVTISPQGFWSAGTLHTITVEPGALARNGRPLTAPARTEFLTRGPAAAILAASDTIGKRAALDTAFLIAFDAPIDRTTVEAGVRLEPDVEGTVELVGIADGAPRYRFVPAEPLEAGRKYRLIVDGVRSIGGAALDRAALAVRTVTAPSVVRFRPFEKSQDVARDAAISVRFTEPMDRASTKKAFAVTIDDKAVAGRIRFAEDDTVLVFVPTKRLPYGARVVASVAGTARSAKGIPIGSSEKAAFRTVPKPKKSVAIERSSGSGGGSSGGGSAGGGSWGAVERYYLRLMNCTRTGGWVTSGGNCSSPGGRDVAPLKLSSAISSRVARPYAKLLATRGACSHFIGGNPGDRLRRAGFSSYRWAENLGCRSGNPYSAVLASHRFFQSEKAWSPDGGHYVNLMNSKYDRVGIGVWVSSGRVRLVVDFYHP